MRTAIGVIGPKPCKVALDENVSVENEETVLQKFGRMVQGARRPKRRIFGAV